MSEHTSYNGASADDFLIRLLKLDGVAVWTATPGTNQEFYRPAGWQKLDATGNVARLTDLRPGMAVCLNTGGVVVVIDVDPRNGGDIEKVRQLLAELKVRVFAAIRTPSGGKHFYVSGHPSLPTVHSEPPNPDKPDKLPKLPNFPGVDIQSFGANVFLPGTLRPKWDGRGYQIEFDDLDALLDEGDPVGAEALSLWVGEQLALRVKTPATKDNSGKSDFDFPTVAQWTGGKPDRRQQGYLDAVLKNAVKDVSETPAGGRNDALFSAAMKCASFVAGAGMDDLKVVEGLCAAAQQCGLVDDDGEASVSATIWSAFKIGLSNPRAVPEEKDRENTGGSHIPLIDRLLSVSDLNTLPPVAPLIKGLLYRDTLAQIAGSPGSYKSFMSIGMSCALAAGIPFCEFEVPQPGVVVYVVAEGSAGMTARVLAWCEVHDINPKELDGCLHVLPVPVQLGDRMDVSEAIDLVRTVDADLMVLDTRARCTVGLEENSATAQGEAIEAAEDIRRAAACTVMGVHHSPRSGNAGRGSNAWDGAIWSDLRMEGNALEASLLCEKHKDVPDGCRHFFSLIRHTVSAELMPEVDEEHRRTLVIAGQNAGQNGLHMNPAWIVLDVIGRSAPPDGLSGPQVVEFAGEMTVKRSRAYEALKWLLDERYITNVGTDKRPRYITGPRRRE